MPAAPRETAALSGGFPLRDIFCFWDFSLNFILSDNPDKIKKFSGISAICSLQGSQPIFKKEIAH